MLMNKWNKFYSTPLFDFKNIQYNYKTILGCL